MAHPFNRREFLGTLAAACALRAAPQAHEEPYQGVFIIMQAPRLEM